MRLSESHGVAREDFLKQYQGSELDPRWLNRVSKRSICHSKKYAKL
jgi:RNA polymerase primary sigma factor